MGWKGAVRSISSSIKASQREAARRNRELDKQYKIKQKNQEIREAQMAYEEYAQYCHLIVSLHHECSDAKDWIKVSESKELKKPKLIKKLEKNARNELENYKPGIIDKLLNLQSRKRNRLKENILLASRKDEQAHLEKLTLWESKLEEWRADTNLANQLLSGDSETKIKVIEKYNPFSSIAQIGSEIRFSTEENSILTATINVHGDEIIPDEIKTVLQSGKLSTKKMPKGQYNELFQDHVCSVALRVANELFSLLPDKIVIINAEDKLLNTKTGHMEELPILSVAISRETLNSLNLEKVDASDCMDNFVHNMLFKKLKGFQAVSILDSESFK